MLVRRAGSQALLRDPLHAIGNIKRQLQDEGVVSDGAGGVQAKLGLGEGVAQCAQLTELLWSELARNCLYLERPAHGTCARECMPKGAHKLHCHFFFEKAHLHHERHLPLPARLEANPARCGRSSNLR